MEKESAGNKNRACSPRGDEHLISLSEFLQRLDVSENGLSEQEAARRLKECGPNVLEEAGKENIFKRYVRQFRNFFSILLTVGAILSFLGEYLDPGQGNIYIGIALVGVVILNGTFTFVQEYQAAKTMESFRQLLPPHARVLREGKERDILASELVAGDIILLEEGDKVPADGRLIETNVLKVDNSAITGESEPQLRSLECTHPNMLECRNMVFSGTLVQSGNGNAVIFATGQNTQIGSLATLTEQTSEVDTPIRRELNHFIKIISSIAITLGVIFFILAFILQDVFLASLIFAIGIIVANVPEGLLPTVTLALSLASRRMASRNALIKQLESVETLGSTTVICTDKTGTLTQNKMAVNSIMLGFECLLLENPLSTKKRTEGQEAEESISKTAVGTNSDVAEGITDPGTEGFCVLEKPVWEPQRLPSVFIRAAGLCNNAKLYESPPGYTGDPTEGALLVFANSFEDVKKLQNDYPRLEEFPFDSLTKRMEVICRTPEGKLEVYLKGAPEVVVKMCSFAIDSGGITELDETKQQQLLDRHLRLAKKGERIIALAYRQGDDLREYTGGFVFLGFIGILDPLRPEARDAIARCYAAGIKVVMITGDHPVTAESIAKDVGLADTGKLEIITGEELNLLSRTELASRLKNPSIVFARTSPVQKLKIVQLFQSEGEIVTMTGDGVNDAPAIKNADMGVAMGSGTDVAREAADMVLLDDNFATIVNAVEEGRTVFDNIKKFIVYILASNIPEILPFIAFVLLSIPLPMPVQLILAIDLGTDMLPAIALGMEKGEGDIMKRPPRSRSEKLLTPQLLLTAYGVKGPIEAAAGFFCYFAVLFEGGWTFGEQLANTNPLYRQAITAFFSAVIICQIANVFASRTRFQSVFSMGLFSNRQVLLGIASELLILALIIWNPFANLIFNTTPINLMYILLAVPFAVLLLGVDELRKYLLRKNVSWAVRFFKW
ncbi:Sodium/potassium-transporting ATPase, alpha subunit [Methanosarcina horonobensis HB-1 = JCM 15518]|uniref:Sodium/potassium-transporting ATPase, alpha subunit n=1 Tax=Methanosarcina horonobensis HB-1 = JCM 15518 TaxID=1434110 RepID=A0A0E3SAR7_9EURY|nr:cation-transporting P-type ATPase [Methanosarcina horonobensis]AKB76777.1 Sodium/potassium-transporting ATPase, alpha subunit [Methanosarcina horonobensis HB-1 = JCM 15518]